MIKNGTRYRDIYNYRNSKHFIQTVKKARKYDEKHGDNLVIFAGACQSYFEAIMDAGANFASSPARILIDFLDPLIVAKNVAITDKNDEGKLVSHRFPQFSFDKCLKSNFFKYLILDEKFRKHLELSSPGGAGRNRVLKISDMLEYKIYLPSIDEQTEIGQYFSHLDNLITLHQRELEILKNLKKTCLKRMFI